MDYLSYKKEVFDTTLKLVEIDLIRLSSGNISVRLPDNNIAITPSGVPYDQMAPEDIVIMDLTGKKLEGEFKPSSEKALHNEIYKAKPDVHAVVHTHSVYAIAFSSVGMELPVMCIELLSAGAPIPVAAYRCPGTEEVGIDAAQYFVDRPRLKGLLLKNHGLVAIGKNLNDAYQNAYKIETGAEIYHLALQTGVKPTPLNKEQIEEALERYQAPKEK
ncbi:MAG TPA: class II aldolase/adducin family protein [Anaerolineaceae bacterium]|nr:class II aldolase/adducin family protein [Anaerolineaceae bacterium]